MHTTVDLAPRAGHSSLLPDATFDTCALNLLEMDRAQDEYLESLIFIDEDGVAMSNLYKVSSRGF